MYVLKSKGMRTIRNKTILLTTVAIVVSIATATTIAAISIAKFGHESIEQSLALQCDNGKNNLNNYFKSVEQTVNTVSTLINYNLENMSDEEYSTNFSTHVDNARELFYDTAINTAGVLTYYYRVDLSITEATGEKGFWYTNLDGKGFVEHEVTDLSDDEFECVWFYTPKESGKPLWLPPYVTDNLDIYVVSYNVPVYRNDSFVGVVGIEISYQTLGNQIDQIKFYETGYAFIIDDKDWLVIYHPTLDILNTPEEDRPAIPDGFVDAIRNENHHIVYTFEGVQKHSYWVELTNDMIIVVAIDSQEITKTWEDVVIRIIIASLIDIAIFVGVAIFFSRRITEPLKELTVVAEEINKGNYQVNISTKRNDEIGTLSRTVGVLVKNLDEYISDLNALAYADALTTVANKSAFDIKISEIQKLIDNPLEKPKFAVAIFDCDNLKEVNDLYGHDKGDIYIRNTSNLISRVFQNSIVYRLGGDEFAVILLDEDYKNRDKLTKHFIEKSVEICAFAKEPWEQIRVSFGVAAYDPKVDNNAQEVAVHADHLMYNNKRERKKNNAR